MIGVQFRHIVTSVPNYVDSAKDRNIFNRKYF